MFNVKNFIGRIAGSLSGSKSNEVRLREAQVDDETKHVNDVLRGVFEDMSSSVKRRKAVVSIHAESFDDLIKAYHELEKKNIVIIDIKRLKLKTRETEKIAHQLKNIKSSIGGDMAYISGTDDKVVITPRGFDIRSA